MRTLICLALAACTSATAAPPTKTDVRTVGTFHGLDIATVIDVDVTIGPTTRVELKGPSDWTAKISTNVTDGVLRIALPNDANHVPKLSAVITVPDLTSVAVSGVAGVHVAKLAAKMFDVTISGVGSVDLAGTADTLHVVVSGTGQLAAKDLGTSTTTLDVSGVGSVTILGKPAAIHKHVSGVAEIHD